MSGETLLSLENITKHYPVKQNMFSMKKSFVKAVNGVTLEVKESETLGVVGESGCGKSTLGRTILNLEKLTSGHVVFNGEDISQMPRSRFKGVKKEMQMIFQDPFASLDPRQKVGKAIEEPLIIHTKMSKQERKQVVENLLLEVGLKKEHRLRYPHEFSGGQRQRIGIARAIALNPKLIVCDEPVSALDVSVQAQVIKLLQELQKKHHLTYIFISHDLGVVRYICNRVLVMYLGHMAELAPVNDMYETPLHPYTKTLLSAIPRPSLAKKPERIKLASIDLPSSPGEEGCAFSNRCPIAVDKCHSVVPEWREVKEGHFVACHEV